VRVTVRYQTQIKRAVGLASETLEVPEACPVAELLRQLAQRHGDAFRRLVLKEGGLPQDSILVFLGERQVADLPALRLSDGDVLTLLAPMAGG